MERGGGGRNSRERSCAVRVSTAARAWCANRSGSISAQAGNKKQGKSRVASCALGTFSGAWLGYAIEGIAVTRYGERSGAGGDGEAFLFLFERPWGSYLFLAGLRRGFRAYRRFDKAVLRHTE